MRIKWLVFGTCAISATGFACVAYAGARDAPTSFVVRRAGAPTVAINPGGRARRLSEPLASAEVFAWSRSGVVAYGTAKTGLYVRAPGRPAKRIAQPDSLLLGWKLAWSPDGRRLAYYTGLDIFVVSLPGGRARRLVRGILAGWAGSKRIAFIDRGLYTMSADGGRKLRVGSVEDEFAWTSDGRTVALTRRSTKPVCIRRPALRVRCTPVPGNDWAFSPRWSPRHDRVAFVTNDERPGVWMMRRDGTNLRRIVSGGGIQDLLWSPDGSKIAYRGSPANDRTGLKSAWSFVSADGGRTRPLITAEIHEVAWVPREHLRPFELQK